jgi:hypothetical protein
MMRAYLTACATLLPLLAAAGGVGGAWTGAEWAQHERGRASPVVAANGRPTCRLA